MQGSWTSFADWKMALSDDEVQKIWFSLKLGNAVPCDRLFVIDCLESLDYIHISERLDIELGLKLGKTFENVYICTVLKPLRLLLGDDRLEFATGDVFLQQDMGYDRAMLIPADNKEYWVVGARSAYKLYVFHDGILSHQVFYNHTQD